MGGRRDGGNPYDDTKHIPPLRTRRVGATLRDHKIKFIVCWYGLMPPISPKRRLIPGKNFSNLTQTGETLLSIHILKLEEGPFCFR